MSYFGNIVVPPRLIDPNSIIRLSASTVLTQQSYGKVFLIGAPGNFTITLMPLRAGSKALRFMFVNDTANGTTTINTAGADTIRLQGIGVNTISLIPGGTLELENNGESWSILSSANSTPPGIVSPYAGTSAPNGYLMCFGDPVSRTNYSRLFDVIGTTFGAGDGTTTFNLPDLRGEFVRGFDAGKGVDPSRVFGSRQLGQNEAHVHTGSALSAGFHSHTGSTSTAGSHYHGGVARVGGQFIDGNDRAFREAIAGVTDYAGDHSHALSINGNGDHVHTLSINSTGGTEARPRNVAMNFIIKY